MTTNENQILWNGQVRPDIKRVMSVNVQLWQGFSYITPFLSLANDE